MTDNDLEFCWRKWLKKRLYLAFLYQEFTQETFRKRRFCFHQELKMFSGMPMDEIVNLCPLIFFFLIYKYLQLDAESLH